jgi:hypothetical protein
MRGGVYDEAVMGVQMKINVNVEIGTEGVNCWGCKFGIPGHGPYCNLFNINRVRDVMVYKRCEKCLEAEKQKEKSE